MRIDSGNASPCCTIRTVRCCCASRQQQRGGDIGTQGQSVHDAHRGVGQQPRTLCCLQSGQAGIQSPDKLRGYRTNRGTGWAIQQKSVLQLSPPSVMCEIQCFLDAVLSS